MSQALVQMWLSTLVITFTAELGLSEKWASTLGIVIGFSSVATSIIVGTFMDYFRKKMKLAIIVTLSGSLILSVIITLISEKVIIIEDDLSFKITLYILSISAVSLACSAAPITFEFCVEECFPVSEGLLGMLKKTKYFWLLIPTHNTNTILDRMVDRAKPWFMVHGLAHGS